MPARFVSSMLVLLLAAACAVAATSPTAVAQQPEYELPDPPPASPSYLNPFPVVRLAGRVTSTGARITLLQVRSPRGSSVKLRCRGGRRKGCPFRTRTRTSPQSKLVRFRKIERRLRAGVILEVSVRKGETIGKFTSFRIRKRKTPRRNDSCLMPGDQKPSECPE